MQSCINTNGTSVLVADGDDDLLLIFAESKRLLGAEKWRKGEKIGEVTGLYLARYFRFGDLAQLSSTCRHNTIRVQ